MENTIKTENGIITIKYVPKHYNFEMLALDGRDNFEILYVEYTSNLYRKEDYQKIKILFKELEPQIIQIMKFYVIENIEFYKHFDIDYTLIGESLRYTPRDLFTSYYFDLIWTRFLKLELKKDSLEYLKDLADKKQNSLNIT